MTDERTSAQANKRLAWKLLIVAVAMFGFALGVLPPMYRVVCQLTGLNGKPTNTADSADGAGGNDDRVITVQFLADTDSGMPWEFHPNQRSVKVHPGEITKVDYHAANEIGTAVIGQAIPSIAPSQATPYFKKTECFCFTQQELKGGEARDMPLIFYIDPELPKSVTTITLSYEMFNVTDRYKKDQQQLATTP